MICPIDSVPQNGEIVEIITSGASRGPSRDWLKIVRTAEARNKIRSWFKKEKRAENIEVGRAEIEREMRRYGCPYTEEQKNEVLSSVSARMGIQSVEDLYNTIGYGGLSVNKLSAKIKDEFDRTVKEKALNPEIISVDQVYTKPSGRRSVGGVIIDGVDGCSVKFAKCCNPLPGDEITGFITKGYGVSIHKTDCPMRSGCTPTRQAKTALSPLIGRATAACRPARACLRPMCRFLRPIRYRWFQIFQPPWPICTSLCTKSTCRKRTGRLLLAW